MNQPPALAKLTDSQLWRLIYSNWDFQQALSALTFLMEECNFKSRYTRIQLRKFRCYETSVIVSFARPFETSRGQTTIGLKAIGVRLDEHDSALKEKILALRRKIAAHSDEEFMHFRGQLLQPFEDVPLRIPLLEFSEGLHLIEQDLRPLEGLLRRLMEGIAKALYAVAQATPDRLSVYKAPGRPPADA